MPTGECTEEDVEVEEELPGEASAEAMEARIYPQRAGGGGRWPGEPSMPYGVGLK